MDPHGEVQGPFPSVQMFLWYREDYFTDSLELRLDYEEGFRSLRKHANRLIEN